ncbi:MAG: VTT domain-containing protein [Candidatus Omnitrophota bacterium]|nr:VTT domain-containing protein [Candidatus Omnitrophota bacterium]
MNIKKYKQEAKFLAFVILAAALIFYFQRFLHIDTELIQRSLQRFPLFCSGFLYIALYVIITFFVFFSKDIFWLIGALLFGAPLSAAFICIAESINAAILFYLSRNLGRAYVEKSLTKKYERLDKELGGVSFFWLFILRTTPLVPYRFMDLASGLTSIRFKKYLAAVILGSPLKIFWIQYILAGVGKNALADPQQIAEYFLKNKGLMLFSFVYVLMVVMVIFKISANRKRDRL